MSETTKNEQFGQKIGVDDVSPPKVGQGPRASDSQMVDDPNQGQKVRFVLPLKRPPPPQEASEAAQRGVRDDAGPADIGLIPEKPSVWEALDPQSDDA